VRNASVGSAFILSIDELLKKEKFINLISKCGMTTGGARFIEREALAFQFSFSHI